MVSPSKTAIPAYAGCIWDNVAVLGDTIKGTPYTRVTGAYVLQRIYKKGTGGVIEVEPRQLPGGTDKYYYR